MHAGQKETELINTWKSPQEEIIIKKNNHINANRCHQCVYIISYIGIIYCYLIY